MLPIITIDGRLTDDPELRFTPGGKAVASFRVAANDAKRDENGNWENTEQIFINVSVWEADGEQAAEDLRKGDRVLITGKIFQREYDRRDGSKGTSLDMKFPTVAKVVSAGRRNGGGGNQQPRQQRPQQAPQGDPWAGSGDPWAAGPSSDEPPF